MSVQQIDCQLVTMQDKFTLGLFTSATEATLRSVKRELEKAAGLGLPLFGNNALCSHRSVPAHVLVLPIPLKSSIGLTGT